MTLSSTSKETGPVCVKNISSQIPAHHPKPSAQGWDQDSVSHPALSPYLFITLAQQPLQEQHQLGEGGSSLKLLFPALLHDLIARGGRERVRVSALEAGPCSKGQSKVKAEDAGKEQHHC